MKHWKILSSKQALTNKFFKVRKNKCLTARSKIIKEYYVKEGRGSAMIFTITPDQRVIVEEQYRHGIRKISFDLPCGQIEKGESPLKAAKRELLEETGYQAKIWILLGKLAYNPASSEEYLYIFLAQNLINQGTKKNQEKNEEMKLHFISLDELENYVVQQKISCALCVAAISLTKLLIKKKFDNQKRTKRN